MRDTQVAIDPADPTKADKNYGASNVANAGMVATGDRMGLFAFDDLAATLPDQAYVTSATLSLSLRTSNQGPDYSGRISADVTSLVRGWADGSYANDGLLLEQSGPSATNWWTSEFGAADAPRLEVCYLSVR